MANSEFLRQIQSFKAEYGLNYADEDLAVTMHIMSVHRMDRNQAIEQSSHQSDDHGIDGWFLEDGTLLVYQGKFTDSKSTSLSGFESLERAAKWLGEALNGRTESPNTKNNCLYTLALAIGKSEVKNVSLVLLTLSDVDQLKYANRFTQFKDNIADSVLNKYISDKGGNLQTRVENFTINEDTVPKENVPYEIVRLDSTTITMGGASSVSLAYIRLDNLIDLYRRRGTSLFNKNIRLALNKTQKGRERLAKPMQETLESICSGKLPVEVFTFYHDGVTISAQRNDAENDSHVLKLTDPSIINGCQTITIADEYLRDLERAKKKNEISKFREIKVLARVMLGLDADELKNVTNANNRSIPIEDWQLFSNDRVHIQIEDVLKRNGIFYERQAGEFEESMRQPKIMTEYYNTNKTCIKVKDLGRAICLAHRYLQKVAKPTNIFISQSNHDDVFLSKDILDCPKDMVLVSNVIKALERALNNYLNQRSSYSGDVKFYTKPIVKSYLWYFAMMDFYQNSEKAEDYGRLLYKNASSTLVKEIESIYRKIIPALRKSEIYTEYQKSEHKEASSSYLDNFLDKVLRKYKINGPRTPFTKSSRFFRESLEPNSREG